MIVPALFAIAVAHTPPVTVAVVAGSNHSPSSQIADLRYADDDAIQDARTMALLGADTTLLVTADAETRDLFPAIQSAGPATRDALVAALERAFTTLRRAHAA